MATYNETPQTGDMLQALSGLNYLVNGVQGDTTSLQGLPASALASIVKQAGRGVDANTRPRAQADAEGNVTAADMNAQVPARDKLKDLIAKRAAGTITDIESSALKSAMYMAGYEVDLASLDFTTNELTGLASFNSDYLDTPNATFESLRASNIGLNNASAQMQTAIDAAVTNAQARDAAEVAQEAALDQSLNSQFNSLLVYSGGLNPQDIDNDIAREFATRQLLIKQQHTILAEGGDINSVMGTMFEQENGQSTGQVTQAGLDRLLELTEDSMVPARLESDLESDNPLQISIAQNYLTTQGYNHITADGILRTDTVDAAEEFLSREQTIPEGILEDGGVNYEMATDMARNGQLLLPSDEEMRAYMGEDYEGWAALPAEADRGPEDILSREEFAGLTLLGNGKYQEFLNDYNAAHASEDFQLDAVAELTQIDINSPDGPMVIEASLGPVLATPDHTVTDEVVAARNYVDAQVVDTEIIGGSSRLAEEVQNDAIGYTDEGSLAFDRENRDLVTEVYADAFTGYAAANGGEMSMHDALRLSHGITTTDQQQFLGGATGMTQAPTQYEAQRLAQEMGFDMDKTFNPVPGEDNPDAAADMQSLLRGTYAWENKQSLAEMGPGNYVQNFMAGNDAAPAVLEMQASISRVTGMHSEGVTDVLLAQDAPAPAVEQAAPQETVTAEVQTQAPAPETAAPTLPLPTPDNISHGSIIPTPGMFERHAPAGTDTTTQLSAPPTTSFNSVAPINTGIPADLGADNDNPAGVDLGNVANRPGMSQANPDIFGTGTNGGLRQSTVTSFPTLTN